MPLRLSRTEWRALLYWFVRGVPSAEIAHETGLERKRVLRALTIVREAMRRANPARSHVDEEGETPRPGRPASRSRGQSPVALYARHGLVGADVIPNEDIERTLTWLRDRTGTPAPRGYAAIAFRGRLHRVQRAGLPSVPFGQIESFWAYLQRHLRAKGGIRPARLTLYLAEFAWRYNRRKLSHSDQSQELLRLLGEPARWTERYYSSTRKSSSHADWSSIIPS